MTKIIELRCYFQNSEKVIDNLIKDLPLRAERIRKREWPLQFMYEFWYVFGDEDNLKNLEKAINEKDLDIETYYPKIGED